MFISFLGLGQGGSNIADEAASHGFYTSSINYSQRDLDSLEHIELKLKLVGSEGIGKARSEAIRLMNNNWDLATTFVKENYSHSSIEIIFVPFSTSGGSGSGIAPVLLNILCEMMPDKVFVAMPIIPDSTESYISQKNCLETFEDLSDLNICILPIDNDKYRSMLGNVGKNVLYKSINQDVIKLIKNLVAYTDRQSKFSAFDKKDLKAIFSTKGIATISETNLNDLIKQSEIGESSISEYIQKSWLNSCFAEIEFNQIISAGFIFDGNEKLMQLLNLQKIFSPFANEMPINLFEGYFESEENVVTTILSGLDWCNSRLKKVENIAKDTVELFNKIETTNQYKSNVSNFQFKLNNQKPITQKVKDISSIINKFKR
ncbi:cell division protein FtsZ [Anoxybacillus flavithermus]|uniref:cell division protein FtsZ n=1 Tax=Anoxybacillus flavithermus TaxID=33934 RepID=UPI001868F376|nr:cell division protein FtsZ [Anoxybacillus flavithermus]MBE2919385.1 cell division protein FtsZ [Anoxybacillus flavithermus]